MLTELRYDEQTSGRDDDRARGQTSPRVQAEEVLLTFKEAIGYLRVSRSTLYRLMRSGQLPGHKVGGVWRFSLTDVRACVRTVSPEAPDAGREAN